VIMAEAGGVFSDFTGTETIHGGNAIASANQAFHDRMLTELQQHG